MSTRLAFPADINDPVVLVAGRQAAHDSGTQVVSGHRAKREVVDRATLPAFVVLLRRAQFTKTTAGNMRLDVYRVMPSQPLGPPVPFLRHKTKLQKHASRTRQSVHSSGPDRHGARNINDCAYFNSLIRAADKMKG
jgi:hypothetical protein